MINISITNNRNRAFSQILGCCLLTVLFIFMSSVHAQGTLTQDDQALFGKAQSLNNLEHFSEALDILRPLHAAYPADKKISVEFAKALGYGKHAQEAVGILERLNAEYPEDQEIKRLLANVLEANGQFQKSLEKYLKLYRADQKDQSLLQKVADLSMWTHDYESAVGYYKSLIEADPDNVVIKVQLAEAAFYSARYDEAVNLYRQVGITPQTHEQAYRNLAYSHFVLKDYEASIKAYRELEEELPDDLDVKAALAGVLYTAGRYEEAEKYFKEVIAAKPQDVATMLKLAEILSLRKEYAQAVTTFERILAIKPDHKEAKLGLARVFSWDKQYEKSLEIYTKTIEENPDWVIARREQARILGWQRQYQKSIDAYREIAVEGSEKEIVNAEKQAKNLMYHYFDASAIEEYKIWLENEPENLEALFDLGQIYARNRQWTNANRIYGKILKFLPEHQKTQQVKQKIALYSASPLGMSEFEFYEADSSTRSADVRYYSIKAGVNAPLSEQYSVGLSEKTSFYEFSQDPLRVTRNRITGVLEYYQLPLFEAKFGYAYNSYSDGLDNTHNFFEHLKLTAFDGVRLEFSHERRDIIDNAATLNSGLYTDDYRLRLEHKPNRRLHLGADYIFSNLSDGNERQTFGVDVETLLFYEPRRLSLIYRFDHYGYDTPSNIYFSPSSFHSNIIGFEWEHFLNEEELYWGANDTFYTFRYLVNFDVNDQTGHTMFLGFQHDFNDRSFMRTEFSKKIYEHQSTYSEVRITASVGIYF